jgi:hypothetical protein
VECSKPLPAWINAVEECSSSEHGAMSLDGKITMTGKR